MIAAITNIIIPIKSNSAGFIPAIIPTSAKNVSSSILSITSWHKSYKFNRIGDRLSI